MSHQSSTTDQLKDKAQAAYDTIARTVAPSSTSTSGHDESPAEAKRRDFTKDSQGQECQRGDYQDQLSKAAAPKSEVQKNEDSLLGKVASMIPGTSKSQEPISNANEKPADSDSGGIKRPDHDVQVEEFLRKQYRSYKPAEKKVWWWKLAIVLGTWSAHRWWMCIRVWSRFADTSVLWAWYLDDETPVKKQKHCRHWKWWSGLEAVWRMIINDHRVTWRGCTCNS